MSDRNSNKNSIDGRNEMDNSNIYLNSNETTNTKSNNNTNGYTSNNTNNVVRVGIGCIVFNEQYEIYVGVRKNSHGNNTIALPGGHLELYEDWNSCAQREVYEEMNIKLNIDTIQFVSVYNNPMMDDNKHYITIIMICTAPITEIPINMEPHKCEGWIPYSWNKLTKLSISNPEKFFQPLLQLIQTKPILTIVVQSLCIDTSHNDFSNIEEAEEK